MEKNLDYYLKLPYTIEIQELQDEGWFVKVKELPGCMSQGDSAEDAMVMIQDAMHGWLEVALEEGAYIPEPRPDDDYSGKFVVRVPRSLHRQLVGEAEAEGVSLNTFCISALAEAVGLGSIRSKDKETHDEYCEWEIAANNLLETIDGGATSKADLEDRFSYWLDMEMTRVMKSFTLGDVSYAIENLYAIEKLLWKFGKSSAMIQSIRQALSKVRLIIEKATKAPSSIQVLAVGDIVDEVNQPKPLLNILQDQQSAQINYTGNSRDFYQSTNILL